MEARPRPEPFAEIVCAYGGALFRYCWGRLRDRGLAEDAVQEVFLRTYSSLRRIERGRLGGWLFGVARRACQETLRKRRWPPVRAAQEVLAALPAQAAAEMFESSRLDAALESLDDDERSLVYLKHVENLKCREIAESLRVPLGTVTSGLSRAYRKLRVSLKTKEVEP